MICIWLIGISGAGKTTLGSKLKKHFDEKNLNCYMIDGDIIRKFFDNDLGYTPKERHENIKRIILASHVLTENNIITIVCNISPFESLRMFARKKIKNYNQIYLKRSLKTTIKNDVKGIYEDNLNKTDIVGVNFDFENPSLNELILNIDKQTEQESYSELLNFLFEKYGELFNETKN